MIVTNTFDIPFLAMLFPRVVQAAGPTDRLPYDLSGSSVWSGSYDFFDNYDIGTTPTDRGTGWAGDWQFAPSYLVTMMAIERFSGTDYSSGQSISGSDGGAGWAGPWNVVTGE